MDSLYLFYVLGVRSRNLFWKIKYYITYKVCFSRAVGCTATPLLKGSETFMFNQFRVHYPTGSLVTELSAIDHGMYIVRCLVQVDGTTLVTGLAAARTVELAEDEARSRALAVLGISPLADTVEQETSVINPEVPQPLTQEPVIPKPFVVENLEQPQLPRFPEPAIAPIREPEPEPEPVFAKDTPSSSSVEPTSEGTKRRKKNSRVADEATLTAPVSTEVSAPPETDSSVWMTPKPSSQAQLDDVPTSSLSSEVEVDTNPITPPETPIDFSDIIARTNVELKRLGWNTQQGKDYLLQTYGKRSRQLLTDAELLDFLHHLESQPTPD